MSATALARLRAKLVRVDNEFQCQLWTGQVDRYGYGKIRVGSRTDHSRKMEKTHKLAWETHHGIPVPKGKLLRHRCDTRRCCNPECLTPGTNMENVQDMIIRRRAAWQKAKS